MDMEEQHLVSIIKALEEWAIVQMIIMKIRKQKVRKNQQVENLQIWAQLKVILEVVQVLVEESKSYLNNNSNQRIKRQTFLMFHLLQANKVERRIMMKVRIRRKEHSKLRKIRTDMTNPINDHC